MKNKDIVRNLCNYMSDYEDEALPYELLSRIMELNNRRARYQSALRSIANSACCGCCQEAALVAKRALLPLDTSPSRVL